MVLAALIFSVDLFSILGICKAHFKTQFGDKEYLCLIAAYSVWISRFLVFSVFLLIPGIGNAIRPISFIILLIPHMIAFRFVKKTYMLTLKNLKLTRVVALTVVISILSQLGENTWDGSAYHLPIEMLAATSKSLFGWPDFIYAQWQQSSFELAGSLYDILFKSYFAGSLISLGSFIFLALIFSSYSGLKLRSSLIILLSVPSIFQQIGTRYIDLSLAVTTFAFYILMSEYQSSNFKVSNFLQKKRILLAGIFVTTGMMFGAKSSSFLPAVLIFIVFFSLHVKSQQKLDSFNIRQHLSLMFTMFFGLTFGMLPVAVRNIIEFSNPLYPYKIPGFSNGLFGFSKVSNYLSRFYSDQIGMSGHGAIFEITYQYILSPFLVVRNILSDFFSTKSNFASVLRKDEFIFRTFVYDNRLGGFGLTFTILMILFLIFTIRKRESLLLIMAFISFSYFPTAIHPRYYLSFAIIFLSIFIRRLIKEQWLHNKLVMSLILSVSLVWTCSNVLSLYARAESNVLSSHAYDQNSKFLANTINPNCAKSIHVGSGLWATTALFGPNGCSIPSYSLNMGGSLIDVSIGPQRISAKHLSEIGAIVQSRTSPLIVICTHPKNKVDPCIAVTKYLSKMKVNMRHRSGSEAVGGPSWSVIEIGSVAKSG